MPKETPQQEMARLMAADLPPSQRHAVEVAVSKAPATEATPTGSRIVHAWMQSVATGVGLKTLLTPERVRLLVEAIDTALAARDL